MNWPSSPVPVPSGTEEQWPAICERCGGNIMLLQQCVANAKGVGDIALRQVVAGPLEAVDRGLEPEVHVYFERGGEAPLWTKDQWKRVLKCIASAPHHAVLVSEIEEELGEGKGSNILLSMVKYNLLVLRPFSTLAHDLPLEVYGDDVVTLPLPAHVWAAKQIIIAQK